MEEVVGGAQVGARPPCPRRRSTSGAERVGLVGAVARVQARVHGGAAGVLVRHPGLGADRLEHARRRLREPASGGRAEQRRRVEHGRPRLVPAQHGRLRKAQPAHHEAARSRVGELLIAVGHAPHGTRVPAQMNAHVWRMGAGVRNLPPTPRRDPRRQPHPVRPLRRRLRGRLQPGHAHGRARRPRRALRPARRAARRRRRRRGAQAQPRLQPDARVRARLDARPRDPGARRPAGVRHGPAGRAGGRPQDRARADRGRDRRRRRHDQRCAGRAQRRPAPAAHAGQPEQERGGAREAARAAAAGPDRARDPAQRRAAHGAVDGRAPGAHDEAVGDHARGAGRAGGGEPPARRGRLRARLLRRPRDAVPRARARREPAPGLDGREAGQAQARVRRGRRRRR